METSTSRQDVEIESQVQRVITKLDVALSFLHEAKETPDQQRQRQLVGYAQVVHQMVLGLQPSLALTVPDEIRINIRMLQIHAELKRHGIRVPRSLQEVLISQRKRSEEDRHPN